MADIDWAAGMPCGVGGPEPSAVPAKYLGHLLLLLSMLLAPDSDMLSLPLLTA